MNLSDDLRSVGALPNEWYAHVVERLSATEDRGMLEPGRSVLTEPTSQQLLHLGKTQLLPTSREDKSHP